MIKKSVICTKITTGLLLFTIPSTQYTILYWYLTALKTEQHYIMFLKLMCNYFFCLNVQNPKLVWLKQRLLHIQPLPSWHVETKSTFSKTVFMPKTWRGTKVEYGTILQNDGFLGQIKTLISKAWFFHRCKAERCVHLYGFKHQQWRWLTWAVVSWIREALSR